MVSTTSGALGPGNGKWLRAVASGRRTRWDEVRVPEGHDRHGKVLKKIRGEGEGHTPSDRPLLVVSRRAGTAVPSEREVVFGHAYAILAPDAVLCGWCGYDNPTFLSVDGVSDP